MANNNAAVADPRDRDKSKRISALKELWPFLKPYKLMILAAVRVMASSARQICLAAASRFPMAGFMDR